MQVDNCILEDGMVYVQSPGSVHIKFCTFRHATVMLQHVNASVVENCEFSQTDSAAVTVEGCPRQDRNWSYGYLMEKLSHACTIQQLQRHPKGDKVPLSGFSVSTAYTNQKSSKGDTTSVSSNMKSVKGDTLSMTYNDNTYSTRSTCSSAKYSHRRYSLPYSEHRQSQVSEQAVHHVRNSHYHSNLHSNHHSHHHDNHNHLVNLQSHHSHMNGDSNLDPRHHWQHPHIVLANIHKHDITCTFERNVSNSGTDFSSSFCDSEPIDAENFCFDSVHEPKMSSAKTKCSGDNRHKHDDLLSHDTRNHGNSSDTNTNSCSNSVQDAANHNQNNPDFVIKMHEKPHNEGEPQCSSDTTDNDNAVSKEEGGAVGGHKLSSQGQAQPEGQGQELKINLQSPRSSRSGSPISMLSGSDLFDGDDDSIGQYESGSDHSQGRGNLLTTV